MAHGECKCRGDTMLHCLLPHDIVVPSNATLTCPFDINVALFINKNALWFTRYKLWYYKEFHLYKIKLSHQEDTATQQIRDSIGGIIDILFFVFQCKVFVHNILHHINRQEQQCIILFLSLAMVTVLFEITIQLLRLVIRVLGVEIGIQLFIPPCIVSQAFHILPHLSLLWTGIAMTPIHIEHLKIPSESFLWQRMMSGDMQSIQRLHSFLLKHVF